MASQNSLFNLIHSLSGREKAYFKKSSSSWKEGDKVYFRLFEMILAQETYEESALQKRLFPDKPKGRMAVAKHDLTESILRSLRAFHLKSAPRMALRARLDQVELLLGRGQHAAANKRIVAARKQAFRSDEFHCLAELLAIQRRVIKAIGGKKMAEQLSAISIAEQGNLERIGIITALNRLRDELFAILSAGTQTRTVAEQDHIHQLMQHALIRKETPPDFLAGQLSYYAIWGYQARLSGDLSGLQQHFRQLCLCWEQYPHRIKREPGKYFKSLVSYLDICLHNSDFEAYQSGITQLHTSGLQNRLEPHVYFRSTLQLEMRYALNKPDTGMFTLLEERLKEGLASHGHQLGENFRLALMYNIMVLAFVAQRFDSSLYWARAIGQEPVGLLRQDIRYAARIFSMVLNFELGDIDALEYDLSNTARFFQRKGEWYEFEQLVVGFIRRIASVLPSETLAQWAAFGNALSTVAFTGLLGHQVLLEWAGQKKDEQKR